MPEDVGNSGNSGDSRDSRDFEDEVVTRLEQEPGSRLWTLTAPADSLSRPVVAGDRVYVSVGGRITAFDLDTGEERWRSPYCDTVPRREWTFTVAGGCVVVPWEWTPRPSLPEGVTITVLETESGTVLRHIAVPRMIGCVSDGRTVIAAHFTDPDWALSGYDVLGGDALWTRPMPPDTQYLRLVDGALVVHSDTLPQVEMAIEKLRFHAYDLRTGRPLWHREFPMAGLPQPPRGSGVPERLIFVWNPRRLTWLYGATGEEAGRLRLRDGHLFSSWPQIFDDGESVWCVPERGRWVRRFPTPRRGPGRRFLLPINLPVSGSFDRGTLATAGGRLYAVDDRQRVWTHRTGIRRLPRVPHPLFRAGALEAARPDWRTMRREPRLVAGDDHVYARVENDRERTLVALAQGRVLWRRPHCSPVPVTPCGDRVLLMESTYCVVRNHTEESDRATPSPCPQQHDHDRLLMVDAGTGATVR
ncbi:PQQ-binding-like beta-propeller repeat protein [Streptomyces sp. V4I2]|uniref:outer membrane protein assembly factor BamB family protein n=1 Tax=Streptomyces sp. V4I2 TaxID=3042280 RepID=UPI00277F1A0E|nr:PQQ-binding-like beta-propeller repeat protein [Streptomyces sp. V4I2]MDQ1047949.1 outer membrane protein assembly factor BamB [Streptomyces sp. V4I2]